MPKTPNELQKLGIVQALRDISPENEELLRNGNTDKRREVLKSIGYSEDEIVDALSDKDLQTIADAAFINVERRKIVIRDREIENIDLQNDQFFVDKVKNLSEGDKAALLQITNPTSNEEETKDILRRNFFTENPEILNELTADKLQEILDLIREMITSNSPQIPETAIVEKPRTASTTIRYSEDEIVDVLSDKDLQTIADAAFISVKAREIVIRDREIENIDLQNDQFFADKVKNLSEGDKAALLQTTNSTSNEEEIKDILRRNFFTENPEILNEITADKLQEVLDLIREMITSKSSQIPETAIVEKPRTASTIMAAQASSLNGIARKIAERGNRSETQEQLAILLQSFNNLDDRQPFVIPKNKEAFTKIKALSLSITQHLQTNFTTPEANGASSTLVDDLYLSKFLTLLVKELPLVLEADQNSEIYSPKLLTQLRAIVDDTNNTSESLIPLRVLITDIFQNVAEYITARTLLAFNLFDDELKNLYQGSIRAIAENNSTVLAEVHKDLIEKAAQMEQQDDELFSDAKEGPTPTEPVAANPTLVLSREEKIEQLSRVMSNRICEEVNLESINRDKVQALVKAMLNTYEDSHINKISQDPEKFIGTKAMQPRDVPGAITILQKAAGQENLVAFFGHPEVNLNSGEATQKLIVEAMQNVISKKLGLDTSVIERQSNPRINK
jgi:plasmid stability protein